MDKDDYMLLYCYYMLLFFSLSLNSINNGTVGCWYWSCGCRRLVVIQGVHVSPLTLI